MEQTHKMNLGSHLVVTEQAQKYTALIRQHAIAKLLDGDFAIGLTDGAGLLADAGLPSVERRRGALLEEHTRSIEALVRHRMEMGEQQAPSFNRTPCPNGSSGGKLPCIAALQQGPMGKWLQLRALWPATVTAGQHMGLAHGLTPQWSMAAAPLAVAGLCNQVQQGQPYGLSHGSSQWVKWLQAPMAFVANNQCSRAHGLAHGLSQWVQVAARSHGRAWPATRAQQGQPGGAMRLSNGGKWLQLPWPLLASNQCSSSGSQWG
eukprot:gene22295-29372_t